MTVSQRREPIWIAQDVILAVHDRQLAEHGGGSGIRDIGMLESALGRPVNQWAYGEDDLAPLAAAYAFGIARNHPFVDENKRTAWVAARLFLALNNRALAFAKVDAIEIMLSLAAGNLTESALTEWFQARLTD